MLFTAVKTEETNIVVKETSTVVKETNIGVQEILRMMREKESSTPAVISKVIAKSLPIVSPYFVTRRRELDSMEQQIVESQSTGQKVFAIIGMGGSGKTQLVSYFMQEMNKGNAL